MGLLAALAACGRIGYEPLVNVAEGDGPSPTRDVGSDGDEAVDQVQSQADLGPDVRLEPASDAAGELPPDASAEVMGPDVTDASAPLDVSAPQDGPIRPETMLPEVGVDVPIEVRPPDAGATLATVVAMGQNLTPRRGGSGTGTVDLCPDGSVLIGYEGTHSQNPTFPWIQSVVGVCATVTFPVAGAPASAWTLTRLPARGSTGGVAWSRLCPARHVLVGFDGNAGSWIGQLVFACAPISLSSSGQAVVLGTDIELDDVGGAADNDFPQTDCPAGQAARGAETRAGSYLEAFGLVCGTLVVR